MLRLIILLAIVGSLFYGYTFYQASRQGVTTTSTPSIEITHAPPAVNQVASVLGASISNAVESGRELLSNATDGKSEPVINQALENIRNEVKDLPKEAVDKVKYEFCKDVVTEYENR